ncbi:MAG: FeoB-associated Cys-rich membrane protein [Clostridia bacterium]|nr:FeoB-associated Cys-rich membrane protein [Clostridia bacterium]
MIMNIWDIAILLAVGGAVVLALIRMRRQKAKGCGCGCGCDNCPGCGQKKN